ncbi:transcriptional regulator PadR family protein [Runella slithyformis DSM 19594]|uniref:Transcriptional regulator PadR family protein n=2 Tax=Runella TaxID=105 RepID=A0A7U4E624_RUNSL|nr:transcriptional regulator PadR family protein [Runella slithyformis DSM 19594]
MSELSPIMDPGYTHCPEAYMMCPIPDNTQPCSLPKTPKSGQKRHLILPAGHLLYIYITNLLSMKGTYLGEFEEVVLLAVAIRSGDAYGAAVVNEIEQQMRRSVNLGAVHSALNRLQEKGLVSSEMGGMTAERGGRRKRLYSVTTLGRRALEDIRHLRNQMWNSIPTPANA